MSVLDSRQKRSAGFTLVELLVVIAIIGILVGMLLPAVQRVREAARRTGCVNNMKNLILACHNYQSANLRFPPGDSGQLYNIDGDPLTLGYSLNIYLLPFLDQQNLYENDIDLTLFDSIPDLRKTQRWDITPEDVDNTLQRISSNALPIFKCPSATQQDEAATLFKYYDDTVLQGFVSHYVGLSGPGTNVNTPVITDYAFEPDVPPQSNNVNEEGPYGLQGVFSPYIIPGSDPRYPVYAAGRGKNFDDVIDGQSNTVAFGEMSKTANPNNNFAPRRGGWAYGASYQNPNQSVFPHGVIENVYQVKSIFTSVNDNESRVNCHALGSNHSGGSQFALVDGSARFVTDSIDPLTLLQVTTINGRETGANFE